MQLWDSRNGPRSIASPSLRLIPSLLAPLPDSLFTFPRGPPPFIQDSQANS